MSSTQRGLLQTMERASVSARHPTLKDWLVSQAAPATPKPLAEKQARADDGGKIRLLVWRNGALN
jgi:hypothetical protein